MVLGGQPPGRVGRRQFFKGRVSGPFFTRDHYNRLMSHPAPRLEDDVIALRRWDESDIEDSVVACSDPEVIRWIPRIPTPYSEQDAREFLALADNGWEDGRSFSFAITEQASGRTVGSIGVTVNGAIGEVGYFVFAGHRRRRDRRASAQARQPLGSSGTGSRSASTLGDGRECRLGSIGRKSRLQTRRHPARLDGQPRYAGRRDHAFASSL